MFLTDLREALQPPKPKFDIQLVDLMIIYLQRIHNDAKVMKIDDKFFPRFYGPIKKALRILKGESQRRRRGSKKKYGQVLEELCRILDIYYPKEGSIMEECKQCLREAKNAYIAHGIKKHKKGG